MIRGGPVWLKDMTLRSTQKAMLAGLKLASTSVTGGPVSCRNRQLIRPRGQTRRREREQTQLRLVRTSSRLLPCICWLRVQRV